MTRRFGRFLGLPIIGALCVACPASVDDLCRDEVCGVPAPPGCRPADDVKNQPGCVVSSFGIFVDPNAGNDASPGTSEAPFRTLKAALSKLDGRSRVYLCEGVYDEHVVIDGATSLLGGFACGTWLYSGIPAKLAPTDEGAALFVTHAGAPLVLADLEVSSVHASMSSRSSIAAVFRSNDGSITLRRVVVHAGDAMSTEGPTKGTPENTLTGATNGTPANGIVGGLARVCACATRGQSTGGRGGDGASLSGSAGDGEPGTATPSSEFAVGADAHGGVGRKGAAGVACTTGGRGPNGSIGLGGTGASMLGILTDEGWTPTAGDDGDDGHPGIGGGGGGGGNEGGGAGGGAGGCGGCGGLGGAGGPGGGSSFAIVATDTVLVIQQSQLIAGTPQPGAAGASGGAATAGGMGAPAAAGACAGGDGGAGAGGSGGGGGAGGSSVAILYRGVTPNVDDTTMITTASRGGAGGAPGPRGAVTSTGFVGAAGTAGVDGIAAKIHAL